jgi:two-component system, NtrC family, sensor histidine kinase HydH
VTAPTGTRRGDVHWIDEAKAYLGFSAADEQRLRRFHGRARHRFGAVIDRFYDVIERHAGARRTITEGPAQVARLKGTLAGWLDTGLAGDHDLAWYESRARIGRRHVEVGLASHYMFTATNLIRADLHGLVRDLAVDDEVETVEAIDRWLDLELSIMVHSYQEDSEQRLLDRERHAQTEKLGAMQRLSAGLAHEVRNPLNAAQLQLQLLARRLRRSGAEDGLLEVTALVDAEIQRLSALLQEFLDFARPVQLVATDTDLVDVAQQVLELFAPAAKQRAVEIELTGDPAVVVACDPGKIHQVLHNLIGNAVDAASGHIEVELRACATGARVRVRDDGPGIPEWALPQIYEPFFSTKQHGTGMGLSITYSLVALHGGTIQARNREGAEFTVVLPARPPAVEAVRA